MSDETNFTPGPWAFVPPEPGWPSEVMVSAMGGYVNIYRAPLTREGEANARLIAAAPELFLALRSLVDRCDGPGGVLEDGSNIDTAQAHAALAKAEGR